MQTPISYAEWRAHWGDERWAETIESTRQFHERKWEQRSEFLSMHPAWELRLNVYWDESEPEWRDRWSSCGGRFFENGRMLAAKWDPIWEKLSATFYDGYGRPYPPYADYCSAGWLEIDADEAIVLGVITEEEFQTHTSASATQIATPISDEMREELKQLACDLEVEIHAMGGPKPGATREERFLHNRARQKESLEKMQRDFEERSREDDRVRIEKDAVFRLMEAVEDSLNNQPDVSDPTRLQWLADSVKTLTETPYFDSYENWRARAWVAAADLHRSVGDAKSELECLEFALSINAKLPVKRRAKALRDVS